MDLIMYAAIMMTPILSISLLNNVLALRRIYYYCHSIFFLFTIILHGHAHAHDFKTPKNTSITSIFIFGDSTVDPGNNDYVKTLFRSNFLPYGIDFPNHTPTGRFTNGRLPTDFIGIINYYFLPFYFAYIIIIIIHNSLFLLIYYLIY